MRIDKYLKISRIIKRRTIAQEACDSGRVMINDKVAKLKSSTFWVLFRNTIYVTPNVNHNVIILIIKIWWVKESQLVISTSGQRKKSGYMPGTAVPTWWKVVTASKGGRIPDLKAFLISKTRDAWKKVSPDAAKLGNCQYQAIIPSVHRMNITIIFLLFKIQTPKQIKSIFKVSGTFQFD